MIENLNKKRSKTLNNIIANLVQQVASLANYFIIPRLILNTFGSNVNGLVYSISQFLGYISLVEGGITGVVAANLYKPLTENDTEKLSSVYNTAKSFYRKIGLIFIAYALVVAVGFSLTFDTDKSFTYVFWLVVALSVRSLLEYVLAFTGRTLLNSDEKIYIVSYSKTLFLLISVVLSYVVVKTVPSIHLLELVSGLIFIIQPIIYSFNIKKYNIDKKAKKDKSLLSQRWNGFAVNLAAFIHNGTDGVVLTIFTDFLTVSVYSVYAMVINGLKQIINAVSNAFVPVIGKAYADGDNEKLKDKFAGYEFAMLIIVTFVFSVSVLLLTPFVMLYSSDVTDADYNQNAFGIVLLVAEAIYLVRMPHVNLSYVANRFKEIEKPSFAEAFINIFVSVILVGRYGLIGVAIGTCAAMLYRMVFHLNYCKKIIHGYKPLDFCKKLVVAVLSSLIGILICYRFFPVNEISVKSFIINGFLYSFIILAFLSVACILFFRKDLKNVYKNILSR